MKVMALETIQLGDYPNLGWLRIHTSEGIVGLGEIWRGTDAVVAYLHSMVAPYLLGQSALEIDRHSKYLLNPIVGFNSASAEIRAAAAVDMALWDGYGKLVNQPLYQLLGGLSRDSIRVYNTCAGYNYNNKTTDRRLFGKGEKSGDVGPYEDQTAFATRPAELAESLLSEGYMAMKIWPFDKLAPKSGGQVITAEELKIGLEPFEKIRKAVGNRIEIMCEMHSLWNYPSALRIAKALEPYDIFWFEDPMKVDNPKALAHLAKNTTIPVCASETVATRATFRDLMAAEACSYVMIDLGWCGGVSEAKKITTMAEAHQLPVSPHDCTGPLALVAGSHLALNAPNAIFQEVVRAYIWGYYAELVTELPKIENGHVLPMTGPGLGTELQPSLFKRPDAIVRKTNL